MFDCYHVARTEGDVGAHLARLLPIIGYIQLPPVPDRGAPKQGTLGYKAIFKQLDALGRKKPLGAECRPNGPTAESLAWMKALG